MFTLDKKFGKELHKLWIWCICGLIAALFLFAIFFARDTQSETSPPYIITYQGKLLESGLAVSTTKAMAFEIYDAETGGTILYTASGTLSSTTTLNVTPSNGVFSVDLGDADTTNAINQFIFRDNAVLYLQVVADGVALSPRKRLTTAPYAFNSEYLMGVSATTTSSSEYIAVSDAGGNFEFSGTPGGDGVGDGVIYINPEVSGMSNMTLFGIATTTQEAFRVDSEGDTWIAGTLSVTSSLTVDSGLFFVDAQNDRVGINSSTPTYGFSVDAVSYFNATSTFADYVDIFGKAKDPVHVGKILDGVGGADLNGPVEVKVSGDFAYVGASTNGTLQIINVADPTSPSSSGQFGTNISSVADLAISGDFVYLTDSTDDDIVSVDVSDPSNPIQADSLSNGEGGASLADPEGIFISGSYAYVASDASNFLEIIDISDPYNLRHAGKIGGMSSPSDVFVSGPYAYVVARNSNALFIVDVSDPVNPTIKGSLTSGTGGSSFANPMEVVVSGNYAYIVGSANTFQVVDISDPGAPIHAGLLEDGTDGALLGGGISIALSGDYAYVASTGENAIEVIDISDPQNPTHAGSILHDEGGAILSSTQSVYISGNYLYSLSNLAGKRGLEIMNISGTRISQANIGTTKIGNLQAMNDALFQKNVDIRGGLFIGNNGLLLRGDFGMFSATSSATATNTLRFSHSALFESSATDNKNAFIFDTRSVVDNANVLSVRASSTELFVVSSGGSVGINSSTPGYGFVLEDSSFFGGENRFVATSTFIATSTFYDRTYVEGHAAYPSNIALYTSTSTSVTLNSGQSEIIQIQNGYAYAIGSGSANYFQVLDISNPASVSTTGALFHGERGAVLDDPATIAIQGKYAYVGSNGSGNVIQVIDISNPSKPEPVGAINDGEYGVSFSATRITVVGNYLYTNSSSGLEIIDISNPLDPLPVGSLNVGSSAHGPVVGNYMYLVTSGALRVLDISDPKNPVQLGSITTGTDGAIINSPADVVYYKNHVYLANTAGDAIEVINVTDPNNPGHADVIVDGEGGAELNGPDSIAIAGNFLYTSDSFTGPGSMQIINIENPRDLQFVAEKPIGGVMPAVDDIKIVGNTMYASDGRNFTTLDLSGLEVVSADLGVAQIGDLEVRNKANFQQDVRVGSGLSVGGGGLLVSGDLGFSASSSLFATNTIHFSHTGLFQSNATTTETKVFVFDTINSYSTANSSSIHLLSVRNNGTAAFSVASNGDVAASGTYYGNSVVVGTPGAPGDLAERVDIAIDDTVEPGDVLVVDERSTDMYRRSTKAYDNKVAGVVSTHPTIVVGSGSTAHTAVMAMIGRVPIKVSTENGPIERGDLLVAASLPGYAMKYNPGTDDRAEIVGIVGTALQPLDEGTGSIMGLVRTGWLQNRNRSVSRLQRDIMDMAGQLDFNIETNEKHLSVIEGEDGKLVAGGKNVDMQNFFIINVAEVWGSENKWKIDEHGRFVTQVQTDEGLQPLYAVQSENTEYIFSGKGELEDGEAEIAYSVLQQQVIDFGKDIKIFVTLTAEAEGVYISKKDEAGFVVTELNDGESSATFDYVVIAERKIDGLNDVDALLEEKEKRDEAEAAEKEKQGEEKQEDDTKNAEENKEDEEDLGNFANEGVDDNKEGGGEEDTNVSTDSENENAEEQAPDVQPTAEESVPEESTEPAEDGDVPVEDTPTDDAAPEESAPADIDPESDPSVPEAPEEAPDPEPVEATEPEVAPEPEPEPPPADQEPAPVVEEEPEASPDPQSEPVEESSTS